MGSMSIWHWLVLIAVVALLFGGRGKVSDLMGDFAKGIKAFKKGLSDDDTTTTAAAPPPSPVVEPRPVLDTRPVQPVREESKVL